MFDSRGESPHGDEPRDDLPRDDLPRDDLPRDEIPGAGSAAGASESTDKSKSGSEEAAGDLPRDDEAEDWFSGLVPPPVEDPADFCASELLREAAARPAGLGLLELLGYVEVAGLSADEVVTFAQEWERATGWVAGRKAEALAAITDVLVDHARAQITGLGSRFVCSEQVAVSELAAAVRLGEITVGHRVQVAGLLAGPWRPLRDGLLAGRLTEAHVAAVGRALDGLPAADDPTSAGYAAQCAQVLDQVVAYAQRPGASPARSARLARRLVVAVDPAAARARRRQVAGREHGVWLRSGPEPGTSRLSAVLPVGHGAAVMDAITTLAADPRLDVGEMCHGGSNVLT